MGIAGEGAKMPNENRNERFDSIAGPDGEVLTRADLPPPRSTHWGPKQKARVVAAVESGLLSLQEARRLYELSLEEFASWQRAIHAYGLQGLRALRLRMSRGATRLKKRGRRSTSRGQALMTTGRQV